MIRFLPVLTAAIALALWWGLASQYPPALLPSPVEVATVAWAKRVTLAEATGTTALASVMGLVIASAAGIGGAVLFQRSRWLEAALYPYAVLVQTIPIVAIAPLLVVWLGYGLAPAVASASIVAFFPVLTAANLGLRSAAPEQVELFRLYRASWWQSLRWLRLPGALPFLFSGLRTAAGLSVIGAIVGEFVGSNGFPPSLGYLVLRSARSADTGLTFGAIFAAAALALFFFVIVRQLERWAIGAWHGDGGEQ
ncbi:MAG: NitT/TauT family transport system permease protein [Myxococcota bacterium]|jgi:NitT/TauT family transport system permease protein